MNMESKDYTIEEVVKYQEYIVQNLWQKKDMPQLAIDMQKSILKYLKEFSTNK